MEMVKLLYGPDYYLHPLYVDCSDQGHFGCARARVYIICAHKRQTKQLFEPQKLYDKITASIQRRVCVLPRHYLIAGRWEIEREAQRTAATRHKTYQKCGSISHCL